jgi:hypothetical protein
MDARALRAVERLERLAASRRKPEQRDELTEWLATLPPDRRGRLSSILARLADAKGHDAVSLALEGAAVDDQDHAEELLAEVDRSRLRRESRQLRIEWERALAVEAHRQQEVAEQAEVLEPTPPRYEHPAGAEPIVRYSEKRIVELPGGRR